MSFIFWKEATEKKTKMKHNAKINNPAASRAIFDGGFRKLMAGFIVGIER